MSPDLTRPDEPMPLDEQLATLHELADESVARAVLLLIERRDELVALMDARVREGYHLYGDAMWRWDAETRLRAVLEELADALAYLGSGEV